MSTHQITTPEALAQILNQLQPGDTLNLAPGQYPASRIYRISASGTAESPIKIQGAGVGQTIIYPKNGKAFRVFGDHIHIRDITFHGNGGGMPFGAVGNHITVEDCSFEEANVGLTISGNGFRGRRLFVYSNEKSGIEVNGGYIYREDWSREPIRLKQALGLLPGGEAERNKWSAEQLAEMEAIWERRDMDCQLEYIYFHQNGMNRYPDRGHPDGWKQGQALYGGQIKAVPNVSGLSLYRCFATGGEWSNYWIDFPSKGKNHFKELYAIGGQHGAHIEGGDETDQETIIEDCIFWRVHQGIFNSAASGNTYRRNLIGAYKYGLVHHGIKGNRKNRQTVAHYEDNDIYVFPATVTRVGITKEETPKGHLVWFDGPNSQGSTRSDNRYYLTPDFPELKLAHSLGEGYNFSPANLVPAQVNEEVITVDELPEISLPAWIDQLPEFATHFNLDDYVQDDPVDDDPIDDPIKDFPQGDSNIQLTKAFLISLADQMLEFAGRLKE